MLKHKQDSMKYTTAITGIISLAIHVSLCIYIYETRIIFNFPFLFINVVDVMKKTMFNWNDQCGIVTIVAFLLGIIVNAAKLIFDCIMHGWPRFKSHDKDSFVAASVRFVFFLLLSLFVVAIIGGKYKGDLSFFQLMSISIGTYISSFFIYALDDAISSIIILIRGNNNEHL